MKKLKMAFLVSMFVLLSVCNVNAADIFTSADADLDEINILIAECRERGLSCDIQEANADIISQFIGYGRDDLEKNQQRAEYILNKIAGISDRTKAELENILNFNKGISVPKYNGDRIYADGMNFENSEGKNIFFSGYLIFSNEQDKMADFINTGHNFYTWEIGPRSTIVPEGTFLPSWTASFHDDILIEEDSEIFYEGKKSVKLSGNDVSGSGRTAEIMQSVMVKPGKTYEIELWIKGKNARGNMIYLNGDSDRKTLPTGTYEWKKAAYEISAGEDQTSLDIKITAQGLESTLWIDNISVREKGREYNFLNNGGFEDAWSEGEFLVNQGAVNYIRAVMEESEEKKIANMILLSPHYIPDWFFENYPEAYAYQEGFLKGNVQNEIYKKFIKTHVQAVAAAAMPFENLHSLVLTNEPIYSTIYCDPV